MSSMEVVVWRELFKDCYEGDVEQFDPPPAVDATYFLTHLSLPMDVIYRICRFIRLSRAEYLYMHLLYVLEGWERDERFKLQRKMRRARAVLL